MMLLDKILSWACFGLILLALLAAPWFFGAWEVWWFWPFVALIFAATALFGLRLLIRAIPQAEISHNDNVSEEMAGLEFANAKLKWLLVLSFAPFLLYAVAMMFHAEVFADAQRSFLLHLTPFLVGVIIVFGFNVRQTKWLMILIMINLAMLGAYGIVNHMVEGSRHVLWAEAYPQYVSEKRASGSYFCPDHFSGIMEIAFSLAIGLLLAREVGMRRRVWAICLSLIALTGVVLSKSRGGGLAIVLVGLTILILGFSQWPRSVRWYLRTALVAVLMLGLSAFGFVASAYMERFVSSSGREFMEAGTWSQRKAVIKDVIRTSSRGRMYGGALRAWDTARSRGIGPGMHQNLWPHFAPSRDGDRKQGIWPGLSNHEFHSYEVHSDWLQLLEEYGVVGLSLFMLPAAMVLIVLLIGIGREMDARRENNWRDFGKAGYYPAVLGGIFSYVALAFHSLGDFNLQMPATVWLLASVVALPISMILRPEDQQTHGDVVDSCSIK